MPGFIAMLAATVLALGPGIAPAGAHPPPDLSTSTKTVTNLNGHDPALVGDTLEYALTWTNSGDGAASNVTATDVLPVNTTFVPASIVVDGDGNANYDAATRTVRVRLGVGATATAGGTLAPGDSVVVRFQVTIDVAAAGTTLVNAATVVFTGPDGGDPIEETPPATETPVDGALADLSLTKTGPAVIGPGDSISYTLTYANAGPAPATGVVVTDTIPAGVTVVAPVGCTLTGSTLACAVGDVSAGASGEVTVTGTVAAGTEGATLTNVATVEGDQGDPDPANNTDTLDTTVDDGLFPTQDSRFVPLTPERLLDTRTDVGSAGGKPPAGATIELQVTGRGGIPTTDVTAVVLNLTVAEAEAAGFVKAWPSGFPTPTAVAINADLGSGVPQIEQNLPNLVTVPVGDNGRIAVQPSMTAHLIGDVAGYYQAVSESHEGRYRALDPARVLDTRPASGPVGYVGDKPVAGQTVTFPVGGAGGVPPAGASAVVLTVTATETTDRGFVTAFPSGQILPWASNLNAEYAGQTIANQVVVPLGPDGRVSLYTQAGTHVVADVAGWFTNGTAPSSTEGLYVPISPTRHLDTREDGPVPGPGESRLVPLVSDSIPAGAASAVVANLTGTEATAPGFVTAYPDASVLPWASDLNLERPGQTLSVHITVRTGAGDTFSLYTQSGTHLVADVMGWYRL